jgi:hypothetical protein
VRSLESKPQKLPNYEDLLLFLKLNTSGYIDKWSNWPRLTFDRGFHENGYAVGFVYIQPSSTEREGILPRFQAGEICFLVTTAWVGGTGITLPRVIYIKLMIDGEDFSFRQKVIMA